MGVSLIAIASCEVQGELGTQRSGSQGWMDGPAHLDQVAAIQKELLREYPQIKIITNGSTITRALYASPEKGEEHVTPPRGLLQMPVVLVYYSIYIYIYISRILWMPADTTTTPGMREMVCRSAETASSKHNKLVFQRWTPPLPPITGLTFDTYQPRCG